MVVGVVGVVVGVGVGVVGVGDVVVVGVVGVVGVLVTGGPKYLYSTRPPPPPLRLPRSRLLLI